MFLNERTEIIRREIDIDEPSKFYGIIYLNII